MTGPFKHDRSTYVDHGCRCDICRGANTEYQRRLTVSLRRRGLPSDDPRHGTTGGYVNWWCRCAACTAANNAARLQWRVRNVEHRREYERAYWRRRRAEEED